MDNFNLLKTLCGIHAPSGNEMAMTRFIINYVQEQSSGWKAQPELICGDGFQNAVALVFGKPRTAVFAHMDNIGFMARYGNRLTKVGSPVVAPGYRIAGADSSGKIDVSIDTDEISQEIIAVCDRKIEPGTDFSFVCNFREDKNYIQSCYLDNRLGVWTALQLAETMTDGAIVFSCWEEHGGGSAGVLAGWLYGRYGIRQTLICDITWVTEGVRHGKGVAVSVRDSGIPRRSYVERIRELLHKHRVRYQVEVESSGGSDGNEIQKSPFPIDWCFVGAPESFVHSPDEKVHKNDIRSMLKAYKVLVRFL
jgi:putative aminopeptidase FrvX